VFSLLKSLREEFSFVHGNVLILISTWAITDFANFLPSTYYSLYVEALGASTFLLGAILSAASLAMAFLLLAGGYWADKYGRKLIITSISFLRSLIFLIFATAPTWHFILLGELLLGMSSLSEPALMAVFTDSLPSEKRGLGYSFSLMVGATSILSPLVAGFLYLSYKLVQAMRVAYLIVSACWFASGLILLRLKETVHSEAIKISVNQALRQYPTAVKECVSVWKFVSKPMLNLLIVFTPIMFFIRMCVPYYVLYADHVLQIKEFQWALLQAWSSIVLYVMLIPIGKLVDVYGRRKPLLLSFIAFIIGLSLFFYGDTLRLYVFFALTAIGNAMVFTAYPSLQADLTPKELRGKLIGFTSFLDCILASGALLLGGFLYENVAPAMPFLLLMLAMIITGIATFFFIKEPKTKEK
jgi:MFS family permease